MYSVYTLETDSFRLGILNNSPGGVIDDTKIHRTGNKIKKETIANNSHLPTAVMALYTLYLLVSCMSIPPNLPVYS